MVLLSGGIDSATCLYLAKKKGYSVRALTIGIHGTAKGELRAAKRIGKRAKVVEHRWLTIPGISEAGDIKGHGPLSGGTVPPTYIPMKNAIYYSLGAAFAEERGSNCIMGGHIKEDRQVFEDTGDRFFGNLQRAFTAGSPRLRDGNVKIMRPLRLLTKPKVVVLAAKLGVPLELTWSCHLGGERQCGKCAGCLQRSDAFRLAEIEDPLISQKV